MMFAMISAALIAASGPIASGGLAPPLGEAEAWKALPTLRSGAGQPLPDWARRMAADLPRTTAALLAVDYAHRAESPLDLPLRARMRHAIALDNRCGYAQAYAEADARRAGVDDAGIEAMRRRDESRLPDPDREAITFARKMTLASSSVTDAEFASLVKAFGPERTASMVLLSAHANFQDRLLLCLGAEVEPNGPFPPARFEFEPGALTTKPTPPPPLGSVELPAPTGSDDIADDASWALLSFDDLQARLEAQRTRATRLPIPAWDEVAKKLPIGFMKPSRVVWNQVVLGYAPELAMPWEILLRTSGAEAAANGWDRIFGYGLFWVTTRAMDCPYCMGHCEMNWEVAGLTKAEIDQRTRLLGSDDWSSFPPHERRAYDFARLLTREPARAAERVSGLVDDFGPKKALLVAFAACRYHYMTRISNGFQLTLERDNVFYEYYGVDRPAPRARESQ